MNKKTRNILIVLLILVIGVGVAVAVAFASRQSDDFAPKLDPVAEKMEDTGEKMEAPKGGGAVSLTYSTIVTISMEEKQAEVLFENPSKSTKSTALQVMLKGQEEGQEMLIAESDLIPAGYKISQLALKEDINLEPGRYEGEFNVLYYDVESGEKEVVDTKIPVSIIVNR